MDMKQFLLITLIALPSLLLAQPTLTFTPLNGATNVSTTADLIIDSDEALKLTDGTTNLTSTNVDALIDLIEDGTLAVGFDAVVDGPRKKITITPDNPLQELTTYTLILQPVQGGSGQNTTTQTITFTTGDFTDPVINLTKAINNTGSAFTFRVNVSEDATLYYVVDTDNSPITEANVRNGDTGAGVPAEAAGTIAVTANTDTNIGISGLDFAPPVKFYIYFFAEDPSLNMSNVASRGIPLLNSSSIPASSVGPFGFDLRVNVDEPVTTYYVVTQSATPPTSAQIIAGQNESGAAPDQSGNFAVGTANTNTDHPISALNDVTTYHVHFVSTDGAGNETVVASETATTPDGTPPALISLSPADNATADLATKTFTITFDENVSTINTAASTSAHHVRLYEENVLKESIDRNDMTVGTNGSIVADGTSATATITFVYDLLPYKNYHILIGSEVFEDAAGNNFAGFTDATTWNFSSSGVEVNNVTSAICSGSFQSIGNIVISETGISDFNSGAGQTLTLSLENTAEFVISNSGITVAGTSADITVQNFTVGMTSLTITYDVAGGTVLDNITISGLKIYATGEVLSTTIIRTGGTADQDGNNGTGAGSLTHATINVGTTPPGQPSLDGTEDLIHCADEDISLKTLTLISQGPAVTYSWYADEALSTLVVSTTNETVNIVTDLGLSSPAVMGSFKFYVVAIDACQSAPPVEVVLQVTAKPVADAGTDLTGLNAVCNGTELTLGGNPTLAVPSAPGPYTYQWNYMESTPEPAQVANPSYTVTNASTTTIATYNFEVAITDVNGCTGTDILTVEVKPIFNISLTSPNSYTFTPNSPNQTLEASPAGGVFTGVGVVQSNTGTYQFSPSIAHATDPNTLPKNFQIYYTVTQGGCTQTDHPIAIFTISNSFFSTLQPEYCGSEYPDPNVGGVVLRLDQTGHTNVNDRKTSWNTNERFSRGPYNTAWVSGSAYVYGSYVRYNDEIYRCNNILLGACSGLVAPDADAQWVYENILKVTFKGLIGNYYEDYYGGNATGSTIVKLGSTYTVDGNTYNEYRFGTNVNYNFCPTCSYAWPAAYLEFERPEDIRLILPQWNVSYYYYRGDLVTYNGAVYQCIANPYTTGTQPDLSANSHLWTNVTNANYSNGQYFHKFDAGLGVFKSGFYVNGQYVQINRNPVVFFSGLKDGQQVCEFEVLNLDNPGSSTGIIYNLTGNFSNQNLAQEFQVRLDGSITFDDGGGTIVNNILDPGIATFDTRNAFINSSGGTPTLKQVELQYQVDPGTTGSTGQKCFGTSSIIVPVVQNSSFDFDNSIVDPDGSVYCYTEPAKGLRSIANATVISGAPNTPNSVSYSGYGVNDLGSSLGAFRPGIAVDQISLGTNVQQSIPVTATYRDVNQCRGTRLRTFKVNPDLEPSFLFGGRANYCYEDNANSFAGHFEDFTVSGSTVSSTGRYDFIFRDPNDNPHLLETVVSTNTSFDPQIFYDEIQAILTTGGYTADLGQTASLNVIYTEILNAGKVCAESFVQPMVINPPLVLDIFGLTDGDILCRNDNNNISQGNLITFDGSISGAGTFSLDDDTDFSAVNNTLDNTPDKTVAGKVTINLLSAYNAATDPSDTRQVYLQYRYTAPGCTGAADVIKGFDISPPPPIAFDFSAGASPPNGNIFCKEATPVDLRTLQNTNVSLSGYGITDSGTGSGEGTFNPDLGFNTSVSNGGSINAKQFITVTARTVDALGCANLTDLQYVVNPTPTAGVVFEKDEFCYEDNPGSIQGQQVKSWFEIEYLGVTTPYTEYIGDINNPVSQVNFDPETRFDEATGTYGASALTPVNFNVMYYVADADNCTASVGPTNVSVANRIDVTIAGLDNDDTFCSNLNNGTTVLTLNPYPADASKRVFRKNGETQPLTSNKYEFKPDLLGDDYLLEYIVYSGELNCSNTDNVAVKVLPSPLAIFSPEPACEGDTIQFSADGTNNLSSAIYTWTLVDSVKTGQTIEHRFPGTNLYGVNLKVAYPAYNNDPTLVCKDSLRRDQVVGANPKDLQFTFYNVCEEDETAFNISPDIPISQVAWDFGDGIVTNLGFSAENIQGVSNTAGTYQLPVHTYAGANTYTVRVTGKTAEVFGGCEHTEEHNVAILSNWAPTPGQPYYDMSQINGGNGGWVSEDFGGNSTWEFNAAAKARIQTNEMVWVTHATEPYKADDISYVNSPCFNLSSFSRPVLSLKHWADTETSDGAVVQYSVDGGENWERLGEVASGLEWYNRLTIASNPGFQDNLSSGWSYTEQTEFAVGKHTLDMIQDRIQVRFRVAFASFTNREQRDGFAFNDFIIEERNRTILVENFTTLNPTEALNNQAFNEFRTTDGVFNPDELVKLQYHHAPAYNGAEPDQLNLDNPVDPNARAAFYGITGPVRAFVDGGFGQSSNNASFQSPEIHPYFSLRSLVTSPVNLSIDFQAEPYADKLNVKATVQATSDLGAPGQYNVFIAIAERNILEQAYVLRKLLPTAAGTPLTSLSPLDPAQEVVVSYDMRHVTQLQNGDYAPFALIVFVQHLETKDVLQTIIRQDGTASNEIVTGIETSFDTYIRLYPNPADAELNIVLPAPVKAQTPIQLFDSFGRTVYTGAFETGENVKTIATQSFSSGVYLIELSTPEGRVRKKAMVVHE